MAKIKKLITKCFATTFFQPLYKKMHYIALKGMNYGSANSPHDSGEVSVLKLLKKELPLNPVIFDVGANNGQYLDLLMNIFKDIQPSIHVFEPDKVAFKKLEKRFANKSNIVLNNVALGENNETATLYASGKGGVDASLISVNKNDKEQSQVSVITLDDYCFNNNVDVIHFMKVDVEGFEMNILKGANKLIKELKIKRIQIEHGSLHSIIVGSTLFSFIELLNMYQCYHIKQNGITKIKYAPIQEIYYNSNYYFRLKD